MATNSRFHSIIRNNFENIVEQGIQFNLVKLEKCSRSILKYKADNQINELRNEYNNARLVIQQLELNLNELKNCYNSLKNIDTNNKYREQVDSLEVEVLNRIKIFIQENQEINQKALDEQIVRSNIEYCDVATENYGLQIQKEAATLTDKKQRLQQVKALHQDVIELNSLAINLGNMVHEQQEPITNICENLSQVENDVNIGTKSLIKPTTFINMGVIRNQLNETVVDEDWLYLSSDGEESNQNVIANQYANYRRRNHRTKKSSLTKPEPTFKALGAKGKSHKKFRRYENANLAMTELGSLAVESELEAVSIDDFIPQTTSPFALLMQNLNEGIDFNAFINCTEDQQNRLFEDCDIELESEDCSLFQVNNRFSKRCFETDSTRCFNRIDVQIRKKLMKKHVPLGILESIEEEIVPFFNANPKSMYKNNFPSPFQRFLLHACCMDHDVQRKN
ncbi:hypothetical protein RDWZM_003071 [Blomia tropicalis]|uniref:t-SNARE coiled-coil homology domain-containing protein n=1 Tax=Blomia tropicalis TaxID=40697 RepID=A0A9Q0RS72_BLOTA|nr:hypothetical protein RDWZM_003071 [Blomia tropicalis]